MALIILFAGTAGYIAQLFPDLCRRRNRRLLAALCSVLGYAALATALAFQVAWVQPAGPPGLRVAAAVLSAIFGLLLVYSVFVEIPLHSRRRSGGRPLFTGGTYGLSRHPGLLWFLLMQLSLNAVFHDLSFLLVSIGLSLGDLALVLVQDRYIFPSVFRGYAGYKLRVPFLLPRLRAS